MQRALHHGQSGIIAFFASIPDEGQDVPGLARSHVRMLSVTTGSGKQATNQNCLSNDTASSTSIFHPATFR